VLVSAIAAYADQTITTTIRDFQSTHSDFEDGVSGLVTGLVATTLPSDKKPVFVAAPGAGAITDASTFAQWYNDIPGINRDTMLPLVFTETSPGSGIFEYNNTSFFPIDDMLFGNEALPHNYHYTLELHTTFTYQPGQTFRFTGDDDLWVYINNQLVVDLGGVHGQESGSVDLDMLGLTPGDIYDFDLYFAERHTVTSVFNIQTSIVFNPNPSVSESIAFDVDSTRGWQTTTLKVTTGKQLSFSTVGAWSIDHHNFSYVSPDGYSSEEDSRINPDCKLDPSLPYAQLLVKVGDDPSFQVIGSEGTIAADRNGFLAFRIHDGDSCLVDNAGSMRVTVTGEGLSAMAQTSFFYCVTGPGSSCQGLYTHPVPDTNLPAPPAWLTSPLAAECLIPYTGNILDKLHPGPGQLVNIFNIAGFYEAFYSLAQEREIPLEDAQENPLYWKTLIEAIIQNQILDEITLQSCRDWVATIP